MDVNNYSSSRTLPRQPEGSQRAPTLGAERFLTKNWSQNSVFNNFSSLFQQLVQQILSQFTKSDFLNTSAGHGGPKGPPGGGSFVPQPIYGAVLPDDGAGGPKGPGGSFVPQPIYGAVLPDDGAGGPKGPGGSFVPQPIYGAVLPDDGVGGPKGPDGSAVAVPIYGAIIPPAK